MAVAVGASKESKYRLELDAQCLGVTNNELESTLVSMLKIRRKEIKRSGIYHVRLKAENFRLWTLSSLHLDS